MLFRSKYREWRIGFFVMLIIKSMNLITLHFWTYLAFMDVCTNCFCTSLLHTVAHANSHAMSFIERARQVLKWTMIGQMAIAIALLGLNALGHSAYAPMGKTASHDNHQLMVSFCFPYGYGALLGGPSGCRSSAIIKQRCVNLMKLRRGKVWNSDRGHKDHP